MKWLKNKLGPLLPKNIKETIKKVHLNIIMCKEFYSPMTFKYYIFVIYWLRCFIIAGLNARQVINLGLGFSFVSRENILKYSALQKVPEIYDKLSPVSGRKILRKGDFYIFCKNIGLPSPKLYAIFSMNHNSISYINPSPAKIDDLIGFIRNELPTEFVIKPDSGELGKGLNIFTKTKRGIKDAFGNLKTEQEIVEEIYSYNKTKTDSFIVQERLKNHPYLLKIHPSEYLHSIRIMTLIDSTKQCKFLHSHLNVATGQEAAAQLGSLKIKIALNNGNLEFGVFVEKGKGGFKKVTEHPDTEQNFNQFKLPFWEEVLSLSKEAAFKSLPLRTLGWDIAITEKGVMFLETNVPYGPPYYFMSMNKFIDLLTEKPNA